MLEREVVVLSLVMSVFHFIQFGDVKFVFFSVYIALAHRVPIFIFVYFVYIYNIALAHRVPLLLGSVVGNRQTF